MKKKIGAGRQSNLARLMIMAASRTVKQNGKPYKRKYTTMEYYKKNPEAYKKKMEYEKKRRKTAEGRKNFNERRRFKRKHGLEGKMGNRDASHTKSGKIVLEKRSANRRRNGEGGRGTKKANAKKKK